MAGRVRASGDGEGNGAVPDLTLILAPQVVRPTPARALPLF